MKAGQKVQLALHADGMRNMATALSPFSPERYGRLGGRSSPGVTIRPQKSKLHDLTLEVVMKRLRLAVLLFASAATLGMNACAGKASSGSELLAGWYSEHGTARSFQPCGSDQTLPIDEAGDLPARARAFGLQPDTPVYVELQVGVPTVAAGTSAKINVEKVMQFGSPTPVRHCAMNGVVTYSAPAPATSR